MESNTSNLKSEGIEPQTGIIFDVNSLYAYLLKLKDRRKRWGIRYSLASILLVLILAEFCG